MAVTDLIIISLTKFSEFNSLNLKFSSASITTDYLCDHQNTVSCSLITYIKIYQLLD